jgi:hypothetical protein
MAMVIQPGINLVEQTGSARGALKVVFKPDVADALKNGSAALMKGDKGNYLTAVKNGKIVGNGQVVANGAARAVAISAAVFQVLSFVTAQKFLADIDQKLATIGRDVKDILNWVEGETWSALLAGHEYLNSISDTIREQELSDAEVNAFLNQLEQIDRDGDRLARMCLGKLKHIEATLPPVTTSLRPQGAEADVAALNAADEEWHKWAKGLVVALQLRGAAAQLRCSLPVNRAPSQHRLESIVATLAEMENHRKSYDATVGMRANALKSHVSNWVTEQVRHSFTERNKRSVHEIGKLSQKVHEALSMLRGGLEDMKRMDQEGLVLLVTLDERGQIETIGQVREPATPRREEPGLAV